MLGKAEAENLVATKLKDMSTPETPLVIVQKHTRERPFGWVFFYNSKAFVETGLFRHRVAGNGPVIVNKFDGSIECFGSSLPVEQIIEQYEAQWQAKQNCNKQEKQ